jgi:membrane protein
MNPIQFIQKVFHEWTQDKVTRLAASLSYYTIFSLAPLLVIIIAVVGLILGADVVQERVLAQLQGLVGAEGAQLINNLLNNTRRLDTNILAAVLAIGTILLGATGVVGELKDALNTIWNVAPKPGNGLFRTFFERVLSLGMVLGLGFLLLVSLILSAGLSAVGERVSSYFTEWVIVAQVLDLVISFGGVTLLFALLFKYLPDVKIAWRDVWVGAVVTALLFTLGKYALGLYLGNSNVATPFGAAGSLVVLFIWVYYAAQILFLGAEITQVYAETYGSGIRAKADAMPLSNAAKVEQGTRAPDPTPNSAQAGTQPAAVVAPPPSRPLAHPAQPVPAELAYLSGKPFNPVKLAGAAIGVRLFGLIRSLFSVARTGTRQSSFFQHR